MGIPWDILKHPMGNIKKKKWEEKKAYQTIRRRLVEIDKKDIKHIEKQANNWGKTLVDKNLLIKLKDFDFWKEWKHNEI